MAFSGGPALGLTLVAFGMALLLACGGGGTRAALPAAPKDLTYGANPAAYTLGTAIPPNTPAASGGVPTAYRVSPELPSGLALNAASGVISGTPTALSPQTAYAVSAENAGGATTAYLLLAVNDVAPTGLSYPNPPLIATKGVTLAPVTPTVSGGAVTRFTTSPGLPPGLALDAATGAISGTPTTVMAAASYHVTASNSGGSSTFDVTITVKDLPPSALSYAQNPATYLSGVEITPNRPSSTGGAVLSYQVAPALPAGLALDPATGVLTGRPAAPQPATPYTVTALNSGGGTTCTLTITVSAVAPSNLTYGTPEPTYTRGQAIPGNYPSYQGGTVADYAIAPALPAGLSLDPTTGAITGTPTALHPMTMHTVTAANTGGSTTCALTITVREAAPANLTYATNPTAYTLGVAIQPNVPSHGGGAIAAYSVSPALPTGLALDPATGVITGTPTVLTPQATYVITGANATGSTPCDFVTAVVPSPIPPPAAPAVTAPTYAVAGQTALQASTQDQGTANGTTYLWTLTNGSVTGGQGTPTLTFTAGTVGPLTLDVKVSNLGGSATGTLQVTVVAPPTAQLFTQAKVLHGTRARASVVEQPGMAYAWSLGGASAGTLLSGTGPVATYLAGPTPGTYLISVDVQSPAGGNATASRTLEVVAGQFLHDTGTSRQRSGHTLTTLMDGRVLVAGGDPTHATPVPTAELYDPYSRTWTPTGAMTTFRAYHAAALLPDGRVLVTGGALPSGAMLDTAEIYDPQTNAWTAAPSMNATRQNHTATVLPDGMILVTGGFGLDAGGTDGGYLASVEVFDPATQSWMSVGPMLTPRANHTATRLQNGLVLVASGARGSNLTGWVIGAELYDPALQTWSSVGNLTTGRVDPTATLLPSGKVLLAGGRGANGVLDDGEIFTPATGSWTPTANKMSKTRTQAASVLLPSGQVLVMGGEQSSPNGAVDLYDPSTNRWSSAQPMRTPRGLATATLLSTGKLLVIGGQNGISQTLANPELYDPSSGTWVAPGLQDPIRFGHTATLLGDGSLLLVGGSGGATYISSAEKLDPATGTWTPAGQLAKGRVYHSASRLADGSVLVAGGLGTGSMELASAERYTPATGTWATLASLAGARTNHTATVLPDGKVLVVGGHVGATILATVERYDPASGLWAPAASLATARFGHTATLLPNGKVLVTGGGTATAFQASAELYDPSADTWTTVAPMLSPRSNHTATLLPDGTVLVMAGQRSSSATLGTVERYDPAANVWSALGALGNLRYNHAATLLPDGRVLVTGGRINSAQTEDTGELYDPAAQASTTLPMAGARAYHTATVLDAAGTVLVLGGSPASTPEFFKP